MEIANILVSLPVNEDQKQRIIDAAPSFSYRWTTERHAEESDVLWADVIMGAVPIDMVRKNHKLTWFQSSWAGPDALQAPGVLPTGCALTNVTGAYGPAISEWMLGMWLALCKDLCHYRDNQHDHHWEPVTRPVRGIMGARVLCVGMGDIGSSFAMKVSALGAEVVGVRRSNTVCPPYCRRVVLQDELDSELPEADLVALSLPNTAQTRSLFDAGRLAKMKPGSILINVGRGSAVDLYALNDALKSGQLFGAAVDVTEPEPLPADHPLWDAPNALITPHISGRLSLPSTLERIVNIFAHNLARFASGQTLDNQVDPVTHYVTGGGRLSSLDGAI